MSISRRDFEHTINGIIKELKDQKKDLELLINMFMRREIAFDRLINEYFQLWKMKAEIGQTLITLPQEERNFLETELRLKKTFEYYEEQISLAIIRHGKLITLDQALALISNIDKLIIELKRVQHYQYSSEKIPKIKDILRRKVGPLLFGSAMIGADIHIENLPTVIGGIYIIYNALVLE